MRELKGFERTLLTWLLLGWVGVLFYTAYAGQLPPMVHEVFSVAGAALFTFWLLPAKKTRATDRRAGITDYLGMALVLLTSIYAGIHAQEYILSPGRLATIDVVFGAVTVVWLLEGARRNVGMAIPILFLCMLLYTTFGPHLPWIFKHPGISLIRSIGSLYTIQDGIWGVVTRILTIVIPAFIIYGSVLLKCGGGEALINLAVGLAGRFTGGPAKIAVVASGMFGMISGSCVANVATTGSFTIPMMKRIGYKPHIAGSIEACASTGGMIMPPVMGAGAFLMATFLGVPYLKVAIAAFVPACLYFFGVFMGVHLESLKAGMGRMPEEEVAEARRQISLWKLAPLLSSVIVLVYFIVSGRSPQYAAFMGTVVMAGLYLLTQGPPREIGARAKKVLAGFEDAGPALAMVIMLGAAVQMVVYLIGATGLGVALSNLLFGAAGGRLFLALFLVMFISIVLGMGVPSTAAYVIAMSVVAGPLIKLGVLPMAAHLFIYYFAIFATITPPVCATPIVAAAIAEANWLRTGFRAMTLGIIAFIVPYMFVANPALMLDGEPLTIILAVVTAILGVTAFAAGVAGYFLKVTTLIDRVMLLTAGLLLIYPGLITDLIGVGIGGGALFIQYLQRGYRRAQVSS